MFFYFGIIANVFRLLVTPYHSIKVRRRRNFFRFNVYARPFGLFVWAPDFEYDGWIEYIFRFWNWTLSISGTLN